MVYVTAIHLVAGREHKHIASVKWRNPSTQATGQSTRAEMVDWISNKGGDARVKDASGDAHVGVVKADPPYIRTHADGRWTDNLLALPQY
jgi:catechol-2,3-dioxygenase